MTEKTNDDKWFQCLRRIAHRVDEKRNETRDDPAVSTDADVWADAQRIIKEEIDEVTP